MNARQRPRPPRLEVSPPRLNLGTLRGGETRQVCLTVCNRGQGTLRGTLSVVDGRLEGFPWLRLVAGAGDGRCDVNTDREQRVRLVVDSLGLPTAASYVARIRVETNGGNAEVPVHAAGSGLTRSASMAPS